jgi:hypothetical protein
LLPARPTCSTCFPTVGHWRIRSPYVRIALRTKKWSVIRNDCGGRKPACKPAQPRQPQPGSHCPPLSPSPLCPALIAAHNPCRSRALAVDRSGMGVSDHEGRVGNPSDMASKGRPGVGPHFGLLPGLRFVENAGAVDAAIGPGRCAANIAGGVIEDQERRRGASHPHQDWALQWNRSPAMRDGSGRIAKSVAPSSWNPPATPPSENQRVRANVVETLAKNRT